MLPGGLLFTQQMSDILQSVKCSRCKCRVLFVKPKSLQLAFHITRVHDKTFLRRSCQIYCEQEQHVCSSAFSGRQITMSNSPATEMHINLPISREKSKHPRLHSVAIGEDSCLERRLQRDTHWGKFARVENMEPSNPKSCAQSPLPA